MAKFKLEIYEFAAYAGAITTLLIVCASIASTMPLPDSLGISLCVMAVLVIVPLISTIIRRHDAGAPASGRRVGCSSDAGYAWHCIGRFVRAMRIAAATSVLLVVLLFFLPMAFTHEAPVINLVSLRTVVIVLPMTWPLIVSLWMLIEREPADESNAVAVRSSA
jgi:hypothetical protein